ncbi:hypothetical protein M513_11798, partial [Trichuris suis]
MAHSFGTSVAEAEVEFSETLLFRFEVICLFTKLFEQTAIRKYFKRLL